MPEARTTPVQSNASSAAVAPTAEELVEESLVEEVSIDGMCGVY